MEWEGRRESVVKVKVLPRSSRNEFVRTENGILKVKLTAPPVEGKANAALRRLLSKRLGVPKANIEIISGERARVKSVRIYGMSDEDVNKILSRYHA